MKKQTKILLSVILVIGMAAGCQKTPDMEYVPNKEGQGSLISDNSTTDSGISIREQLEVPESVQETGESLNQYTSLEIDAKVKVPDQTAVPIYTMIPLEITEDWVENAAGIFFDGGEIHSKEFGEDVRTKEKIYEEIEMWSKNLEYYQSDEFDNGPEDMQSREESIEEAELRLQSLQQELLNAPDEAVYDEVPDYSFLPHLSYVKYFDGDDMISADYYYNACAFVGMHDGKQYEMAVAKDEGTSFISFESMEDETIMINGQEVRLMEGNYIISGSNDCKYSYEEAAGMANDLLEQLGFSNMQVQVGKQLDAYISDTPCAQVGYKLYCYRSYGAICDEYYKDYFESPEIGMQYDDSMRYGIDDCMIYNVEKQIIENYAVNREYAVVTITDSGIISAQIINPMEEVTLKAENVNLLGFDQVIQEGLKEMEIQLAEKGTSRSESVNIKIQSIELNYAYMQSPNNANEYTIIPVWDFKIHPYGSTVLTINAIDGTLFDRMTGH